MSKDKLFPIEDIIYKLEKEAELNKWSDITAYGDTNVTPEAARLIADMVKSLEYETIIEINPGHGILTRYIAIESKTTNIVSVGGGCSKFNLNTKIFPNVTPIDSLKNWIAGSPVRAVIFNFGGDFKVTSEYSIGINIARENKARIVLIGDLDNMYRFVKYFSECFDSYDVKLSKHGLTIYDVVSH